MPRPAALSSSAVSSVGRLLFGIGGTFRALADIVVDVRRSADANERIADVNTRRVEALDRLAARRGSSTTRNPMQHKQKKKKKNSSMLALYQYRRLQSVQDQPWIGMLNYFRTLRAEWDALEALGYVSKRLLSDSAQDTEVWEYTLTDAGQAALMDQKATIRG